MDKNIKALLDGMYRLLDNVSSQADDTIWFSEHVTAHEALVDLAYSYSEESGLYVEKKLQVDMGMTL